VYSARMKVIVLQVRLERGFLFQIRQAVHHRVSSVIIQ
jgi:hypothetical protein